MGKRTSMRTKRKAPQKKQLRGGTLMTELIAVENRLVELSRKYPKAYAFYVEHKDDELDMLAVDGLLDEFRESERVLTAYMTEYTRLTQLLAGLDERTRQDYKRLKKGEFTLSPEERKLFKKLKPLRLLPPIPEVEERPNMERQDAIGMGKKIAFARKYLRGRGIRASQKNVRDIVTAMDVEGVVFES